MNRIAERAGSLGLFATAKALADAKIAPDLAPRDARLVEPAADDLKRILGQMARRGCDPALVIALWRQLAHRPLERALVAVDVLAQAIWTPRDAMLGELRAAADSLGAARPPAGTLGIDLNAHDARTLIERHAGLSASASTIELLAHAYDFRLAALGELARRDDDLLRKDATRESIHAFARLCAVARLPTLASVYLDWLVRGLGWRVAALDLCETLFDAGVAHKLPATAIQPGDVGEREQGALAEYCLYRAHLSVGDSDTANALLVHHTARHPRGLQRPSPRVDVVRAHLGTLYGHGEVELARVEAACQDDPMWRYGAKVRAIVAAVRAPSRALELFHGYLGGFGHDFDTELAVVSLVPEAVKRDVARVMCREAYYLAHDPAPWQVLGLLFGAGEVIRDEVVNRLRRQAAADRSPA